MHFATNALRKARLESVVVHEERTASMNSLPTSARCQLCDNPSITKFWDLMSFTARYCNANSPTTNNANHSVCKYTFPRSSNRNLFRLLLLLLIRIWVRSNDRFHIVLCRLIVTAIWGVPSPAQYYSPWYHIPIQWFRFEEKMKHYFLSMYIGVSLVAISRTR